MKRVSRLALVIALCSVGATGCQKYIVDPGPANLTSIVTNQPILYGTYTLRLDANGANSQRGGACLLYQDSGRVNGCDGYCVGLKSGWSGYCGPEKTCWYRPGPRSTYCNMSRDVDLIIGATNQAPKSGYVSALPEQPVGKAGWRVLTCQNIAPGGCAETEDGPHRVYRWGTPAYVGN